MEQQRPRVGIGVMILKKERFFWAKERDRMGKESMRFRAVILNTWNHSRIVQGARQKKSAGLR